MIFSLLGGFFLIILVPQNLFYLGLPVRISAWLILGTSLVLIWFYRQKVSARIRAMFLDGDIRALGVVMLLVLTFHSVVPVRQGLEWYYGKGHFDQINYVLLAEFIKEEPYNTTEHEIGLRPWLVGPVGFQDLTKQLPISFRPGLEKIGLKDERIGQSILTAEISVWSGTNAKAGYAATMIFFLTLLAVCLFGLLRETGVTQFIAGSGALLGAVLPFVTRLSLNGFLSHVSVLFVFPFLITLLKRQELSPRSFTLFFSLTLGFLIAAYSEIAPVGLCTLCLGVMLVREDKFRSKRLICMSAVLLIVLANPFYFKNLVVFLGHQYYLAANVPILENLAPKLSTLRDWSALFFCVSGSTFSALFFDYFALLLCLPLLMGVVILPGRDRMIFGATLVPPLLLILYLGVRPQPSAYPIAKIIMTFLPLVTGLVFVGLSSLVTNNRYYFLRVLSKLFCATIVAAAATGSARYYSEVLDNEDLLTFVREPRFLNVCSELESLKNKRVIIFETNPLLTAWLCYHARHNNVFFDGRYISDSVVPPSLPFGNIPDLANVDFIATRDRFVDLRIPAVSCLTLIDNISGEDRRDGHVRYWLGPPTGLRFLALRPISADLKMILEPGPDATTFPVDYFLADAEGHAFHGEIRGKTVEVSRRNLPSGLSYLELSVKAKKDGPNTTPFYPIVAILDGIEISEIEP